MPSFFAHFLICKSAYDELKVEGDYADFLQQVDYKQFLFLGSLGPDLPYYNSFPETAVKMFMDKSDKPTGVYEWSYQLHSRETNMFPLKMAEIILREAEIARGTWIESGDYKKVAFILGYLAHMAADFIIHPIVNGLAGPYYKHGLNRETHREVEVFQDIFLYSHFNNIDEFSIENFEEYLNLDDWSTDENIDFIYFIQRAFVETHCVTPGFKEVYKWIRNLSIFLKYINKVGMYKNRLGVFKKQGHDSEYYKKYFADVKYLENFDKAVKLAKIFMKTLIKLLFAKELDDVLRDKFRTVIRNIDLAAPLESDILETAISDFSKFEENPDKM